MHSINTIIIKLIYVFCIVGSTYEVVSNPPGALISVQFDGEVGVLLDEIPFENGVKIDVISYVLNRVNDKSWIQRVKQQVKLTLYRQLSRRSIYPNKRQLPIPPEEVWTIKLTGIPKIKYFQNHLHVSRTYSFYSVLVAPAATVYVSEPSLVPIGGTRTEYWLVPSDPYHVFQRTGYACINEAGLSFDTITSQDAWTYYDFGCQPEPYLADQDRTYDANNIRCHWTSFPNDSCVESLVKNTGYTYINITWTRLQWSEKEAVKWRFGNQTSDFADLEGHYGNLKRDISVAYRYFDQNSCTLKEGGTKGTGGCIGKAGWRRLLRFTSTQVNVGKEDVNIGEVVGSDYLKNGVFEFDPCHLHYHFQHYANFQYGNQLGKKTGFCLITTWRYYNNEWTSLNTPYDNCNYQGIAPGWGDDYNAGLDCQWVDITDMSPGTYNLSDQMNPDNFLCEGNHIYVNGVLQFVPTQFLTQEGEPVNRPACNFGSGYDRNNLNSVLYTINQYDSMVTLPCQYDDQISPKRDCGFKINSHSLACSPGKTTRITFKINRCSNCATAGVVRICESSRELKRSTACEYVHALANQIVLSDIPTVVSFTCPNARSSIETGGLFSILTAPLNPNDLTVSVSF